MGKLRLPYYNGRVRWASCACPTTMVASHGRDTVIVPSADVRCTVEIDRRSVRVGGYWRRKERDKGCNLLGRTNPPERHFTDDAVAVALQIVRGHIGFDETRR